MNFDAACRGKTGYLTWEAARRALSRNRFRPDSREGQVAPYKCRYCSSWHIGKSKDAKRQRG